MICRSETPPGSGVTASTLDVMLQAVAYGKHALLGYIPHVQCRVINHRIWLPHPVDLQHNARDRLQQVTSANRKLTANQLSSS